MSDDHTQDMNKACILFKVSFGSQVEQIKMRLKKLKLQFFKENKIEAALERFKKAQQVLGQTPGI